MINQITAPRNPQKLKNALHLLVKEWFFSKFSDFSLPQLFGVMPIYERKNILISAPTGGTKTLTAFLSILNYLVSLAEKQELENKVYCIYISPLKALNNDIAVNLLNPLKEIEALAEKKGIKLQKIRVAVRTGDTTSEEKTKMLKNPPHILITTPESLAIVLSSKKFIELLNAVEFVIVDEIHALACNKRGVHLSLSLERLQKASAIPPVRIGLSATISPLDEIAKYLVGCEYNVETRKFDSRDCLIADVQFTKKLDIQVLCPVPDLIESEAAIMHSSFYKTIDKLIQEHKTTLIFTNTRSATERVIHHLKEMFPQQYTEDIGAHHSSLSKEHRFNIEQRLREGKLKVVVTSTSLELGIDIGYIDLIILLGSPKSIARALQRIGRAGHKLHDTANGRMLVLDQDDLVECSVLLKDAKERKIDKIQIPKNCLDVLSQHIFGMAICQKWNVDSLFNLVRKSFCYNSLSKEDFDSVISYLAGEYVLEARNVYAKIWFDPITREIGRKGKLARVIYMTNIGTIPDESFVNVILQGTNQKRGVIDENFLERLKPRDVFVLGGSRYEFLYSRGMNAYVKSSVQRPPTIPSWFSEMLPLSFDLAMSIQKFRKLMDEKFQMKRNKKEILDFIINYLYIDEHSANTIYNYFNEQYRYAKIPHLNRLLIEHFNDKGKHYVIFHSLFGRRVNDALSRALAYLVGQIQARDLEIGISDNGFFLASLDKLPVERALNMLNEKNIQEVLEAAVEKTEMFKRHFRHCASRSLMILRNYKGRTKSVGKQQLSSGFLLAAARKTSENFPILKETKREVLENVMDIENAKLILRAIKENKLKIDTIHTSLPSPFCLNLIIQGHADLMKIEDKLAFLQRMHKAIMEKIGEK